jgi:hypothetical protein
VRFAGRIGQDFPVQTGKWCVRGNDNPDLDLTYKRILDPAGRRCQARVICFRTRLTTEQQQSEVRPAELVEERRLLSGSGV